MVPAGAQGIDRSSPRFVVVKLLFGLTVLARVTLE